MESYKQDNVLMNKNQFTDMFKQIYKGDHTI